MKEKKPMLSFLLLILVYGKKKVENAIQQMKSISTHIALLIMNANLHRPDPLWASGV